jgi:DNA-binding NarL/FixJ family response regulator
LNALCERTKTCSLEDMTDAAPKKRIFLVDDHPLVREWLTNLINQQADLVVCGEAESAVDALKAFKELTPDVAIVDITLNSGSGIELLKEAKRAYPKTVLVVLSMHDESLYAERALRAGARAYVMKRDTTKKILAAIRAVLEGRMFVSPEFAASLTERFIDRGASDTGSPVELLSDRELEVFRMLGDGIETRKIAEALHISIKTVQVYCARIKEKLGLNNATELLREAVRWKDSVG